MSNLPEPSGSLLSPGILDAAAEQTPYRMSMPAMARGMDNLQGMLSLCHVGYFDSTPFEDCFTALRRYSLPRPA